MGVEVGLKNKKGQYISKIIRRNYHQKKGVQYTNIKKKLLISGLILKIMVWLFIKTLGQILCWVLVIFMLDGYTVGILNF